MEHVIGFGVVEFYTPYILYPVLTWKKYFTIWLNAWNLLNPPKWPFV